MSLSATEQALSALKDSLSKTDYTGHKALRLMPDDNCKLDFILDTPRADDVVCKFDDVIFMILDSKLSRELRRHVLDVRETSEGTVWTLRRPEDRANSS